MLAEDNLTTTGKTGVFTFRTSVAVEDWHRDDRGRNTAVFLLNQDVAQFLATLMADGTSYGVVKSPFYWRHFRPSEDFPMRVHCEISLVVTLLDPDKAEIGDYLHEHAIYAGTRVASVQVVITPPPVVRGGAHPDSGFEMDMEKLVFIRKEFRVPRLEHLTRVWQRI